METTQLSLWKVILIVTLVVVALAIANIAYHNPDFPY